MAACVERRAACGASYNACASGATPRKFETRQPARPAGKATADRQFQRRVSPPFCAVFDENFGAFGPMQQARRLESLPKPLRTFVGLRVLPLRRGTPPSLAPTSSLQLPS